MIGPCTTTTIPADVGLTRKTLLIAAVLDQRQDQVEEDSKQ